MLYSHMYITSLSDPDRSFPPIHRKSQGRDRTPTRTPVRSCPV